jgi:hypothetical protein
VGCPSPNQICSGKCCAGTGCCGTNCQTTHDNGVGDAYYDCSPAGVPGDPSNYSLGLAEEAAQAVPAGGSIAQNTCADNGGDVVVLFNGASATPFIVWAYDGPAVGHVAASNSGACPTTSSPTWT